MDTTIPAADDIPAMAQQFEEFYDHYDRLKPWLAGDLAENHCRYIEDRRHSWPQRLREADFPVAFLGSFSAGKSTIINAVLGRDLLPENTGSTTAVPTIIRRGDKDEAHIWYLNEETKAETRDLLTHDITERLGIQFLWGSDEQESLRRLENEINMKKSEGKYDSKNFHYLSYFISKYASLLEKVVTTKAEDIRTYVENNKDVIFIDRIEISLKDVDLPEDVALVDLPGLGVLNKRHDRITKEYVERKAKAFVVCLKVKHLIEGEELQFLRGLYSKDRSVLNRAFWVLNQWDSLSPMQRKDEEAVFRSKISGNFEVSPGRDFRVSALNHLMRSILAKGQVPSVRMKGHFEKARHVDTPFDLDNVSGIESLRKLLADDGDAAQFDAFRTALFGYLNTTAKKEFVQSARSEFSQMLRYIRTGTDVLRNRYPHDPNAEQNFLVSCTTEELQSYKMRLRELISSFMKEVRNNSEDLCDWSEAQKADLCKQIAEVIQTIDRQELLSKISSGVDIQANFAKLAGEVSDRLKVPEFVRERIMDAVRRKFMPRLEYLNRDLQSANAEYLPKDLVAKLDDALGERDLRARVHGLADVLMVRYNHAVEEASAQATMVREDGSGRSNLQRVGDALELFRDRLSDFVGTLEVGRYINLSLVNHAEELSELLSTIIDASTNKLGDQVGAHLRTSDAVRTKLSEREKIREMVDAFDAFCLGATAGPR